MSIPVPAALAKRGITGVVDNLQPGDRISFAKAFARIFRPEIEAIIFKQQKDQACAADVPAGSSPSRSE